ncbi:bystin [Aegilops tauschii subsp. strangulata]|uniref:Bystin n=1 Tax=Aegilops tauschii subsp. strangulata TaxID=200361 RepID=A0A453DGR3_AEGTS|nr:bystin [Aegilops tauschii subsp. strangulata]
MAGKKRKSSEKQSKGSRLPLGADADAVADAGKRRRSGAAKRHQAEEEESVPSSISAKILREALKQQQEEGLADSRHAAAAAAPAVSAAPSTSFPVPAADGGEDDDEDVDEFDGFDALSEYDGGVPEIDEEDEKALAAFMSKDTSSKRSLGDIILQKIREKDATVSTEGRPAVKLDSRIIELYKEVGQLLSRYTSGKIPKAFKRIPSLECWADVLQLTEPQNWSPNAVYQATRLFSSNMNAKNAVRFYEAILLPRLRHDIKQNKRLHFALYQSMKKSLYKPAAFFKGILLPLCQEGNCTLREAVIIGSIIQKVTIPPLHASAALMKLADLEYCGTTSYFIKLFLDKKYALPYRVLDAVFAHFMRFLDDERSMPVIWHQSLLAFVERYKNELEKKDKEQLSRLLDNQKHYLVTPEIRRELRSSANRGEKPTDMSICSPVSVITKPIEEDRWNVPEVPMEED